jgi:hypothetical protein
MDKIRRHWGLLLFVFLFAFLLALSTTSYISRKSAQANLVSKALPSVNYVVATVGTYENEYSKTLVLENVSDGMHVLFETCTVDQKSLNTGDRFKFEREAELQNPIGSQNGPNCYLSVKRQ